MATKIRTYERTCDWICPDCKRQYYGMQTGKGFSCPLCKATKGVHQPVLPKEFWDKPKAA